MSAALRTVDLPPEAIALINAGRPTSKTAGTVLTTAPAPGRATELEQSTTAAAVEKRLADADTGGALAEPGNPPESESETARKTKRIPVNKAEPAQEIVPSHAAITVRLPADIPAKLLRVSTDRRLSRVRPWTQQEIVAEALTQWLVKNGYMRRNER